MEYFDVSLEILTGYENFDPESIFAANLKACNNYQLYNGKNAEDSLKNVRQKFKGGDLIKESDLLVSWLSDKLDYEVADEQVALKALQVAEEKVKYQKSKSKK